MTCIICCIIFCKTPLIRKTLRNVWGNFRQGQDCNGELAWDFVWRINSRTEYLTNGYTQYFSTPPHGSGQSFQFLRPPWPSGRRGSGRRLEGPCSGGDGRTNWKIFGSENVGPKLARTDPERTVFGPFLTVFYVNSLSTLFLKYSASRLTPPHSW